MTEIRNIAEKIQVRTPSALELLMVDLKKEEITFETAIKYLKAAKGKTIQWLKSNIWSKVGKKALTKLFKNLLLLRTMINPDPKFSHKTGKSHAVPMPRVKIEEGHAVPMPKIGLQVKEEDVINCVKQLMGYLKTDFGIGDKVQKLK